MSYVKTVWETGDVITAEKLNNIEDGVEQAGEFLKVNIRTVNTTLVLDKTYKEIKDSVINGLYVYAVQEQTSEGYYELDILQLIALTEAYGDYTVYDVIFGEIGFETTNENDYPVNADA